MAAWTLIPILVLLAGCGSGEVAAVQPLSGGAPVIITQPASVSVPMGLTAAFHVGVSGSSLLYTWKRNGIPVSSASAASAYTTPPTLFTDAGAMYTVVVSNSYGSVVSQPATLTITARAPVAGDLRFRQVDSDGVLGGFQGSFPGCGTFGPTGGCTAANTVASFLVFDDNCGIPQACLLRFEPYVSSIGIIGNNAGVAADSLNNLPATLNGNAASPSLLASNAVIDHLNIGYGLSSIYGVIDLFRLTYVQNVSASGFDMMQRIVPAAALSDAIAQDGRNGRVTTAITHDGAMVRFLSYGWTGDAGTTYETSVLSASLDTFADQASQMAAQGYILTAAGGEQSDDFILVGTRVAGDILPRPVLVSSDIGLLSAGGFAPVATVQSFGVGGNPTFIHIVGER